MREGITKVARGRYVQQGLTWKSAALALAAIAAVAIGLGAVAGLFQPEYPIAITSTGDRLVDSPDGCAWEVDLVFRNESSRRLRLLSVESPDVADSRRGLIGVFGQRESIERTYRVDLADCAVPQSRELVVRYGPAMTTHERSVTFNLDQPLDE